VGRSDEQVKVRGYRIELGEVEHALEQQDEIKQAVVVARGQEVGEKQLVAYVVSSGAALPISELRARLRERLPEYMVPSLFVELEQLPLTANGKVDRRRLPEPEPKRSDSDPGFVAPRNELERLVARMWREVLGVEQISVYDNFFDLGGDSIRGAVFINKLQDALGEVVHVVALFDAPTIDDLALYLRRHYQNIGSRFPDLDLAPQNPSARRISVAQLAQIRESIQPLPPARERRTQTTKNPRAVFILAPFRSGSTLLRVMLGGHPGLFAPPELQLLNCNSLQERSRVFSGRDGFWLEGTVRALMEIHSCTAEQAQTLMQEAEERDLSTADFYRELQAAISPRMLVDKTPSYALDLEVLRRAEEYFEEPLYVHLLRHPCGMIRSFEEAKLEQIFRYGEGFSSRELAELIWVVSHENTLEFLGGVERGRQQEVRFEELVREPERVMRELCEFLGVQAEAEMLEVRGGGRMTDGIHGLSRMLGDIKFERHKRIDAAVADRWKQEWEAEDELGEVTCRLAQSLGYEGLPSSATDESLFNTKILTPIKPLAAIEGKGVPLSFAQQRLWFIEQLEPGLPTYNIPAALSLSGPLQLEALRQSLRTLVTRQQSLRSYFALADAVPVQLIAPVPAEFELPVKDLTELPAAERETHVRAAARAEAQRPFALEQGPLLRVQLLRLAEEEHVLLVTMHHIISDGWSLGIFFGELSRLYEATVKGEEARLDELRVQYADYAVWQRGWLKGEVLEEELSYWREQLKGAPSVLELPLDRPRPAVQGYRGAVESFSLSAELTQALKRLSRDEGATLFMTLLACFQLLLWRYSGQAEVVVGTPVANRTRAEIEGLIGFFVNTLVLRVKVEGDWSFRQLLKRVREVCVGAYAHQEVPFERVVEELQPQRSLSLSPLFQVSFALQNAPRERLNFAGLNTRPQRVSSGTVKGDLELYLMDKEGSITGSLVYSTDLFDKPTIARLARHYQNVLSRVVANAEQAISLVELLSAVDREQLLVEWNQTVVQYPQESCLHQLFEAQAERTPDTTAAVFEDEEWSYAELNSCANQLAHYLKGLGVGPEVCVGILLDPSLEAVTAMLATLKAGGYYLPLDRAYPAERLAFMLEDSGARLLLTKNPIERLPETAVPTIYLDAEAESIARCDIENPEANISPENLAYITYTSGSTGIPKGVLITHGSLVNHSLSVARAYELQASDRVLQFASLSFDVSAEELYPTWLSGATVVFCDSDVKASIREFVEFLGAKQVTVANVPTSYWQEWTTRLSSLEKPVPESLRLAIVGSERVPVEMWAEWQRVVGRKVVLCNAYGLTEATITNTIFHPSVEESGDNATAARPLKSLSGSVPIGRPIANTEIYLLDEQLQPLPAGVTGEMYISGAGLARGYHNNSDLTASRFIPHPFRSGARLYRTGDLLRYLADGTLEYVGRRDEQVKVRGHRIELGEIEAILRRHERVCESVLTVDESVAGGRLVAYIVGAAGKAPGGRELRAYLKERLPEYMIPAVFVAVAELPLLPNGKLDRKALPAVDQLKPELEDCYIAPRTPIEELLAAVWCQLLDVPRVGVNDNFFELGGSSLLAMQVIARIQDTLQIKFPLRRIFEEPTVEGLAQALLQANNDERPRLERTAQLLLSLAQLSDAEVESGLEGWPQQAAEGPSSPVL
jgi:amino acid adenylation domain-containing protein